MHYLDILVLGVYAAALVIIGFIRSGSSRSNSEEYLLMGRRLSLPGFVATLVTTWYGGILGLGENTYLYGVQTWFIFALPYYIFGLIFALFLAKRISITKFISIPDHFHHHYGRSAGIVSSIFFMVFVSLVSFILSIGILLQTFLDISLGWALILALGTSMVYIWTGGFGAVIRTDIFQFILMYCGFIILLGFAWGEYGSPISMISQLPETHIDPSGGMSVQYILVWFFIAMWTFVDPGFYQRCAAANSPVTAKKGILISLLFWFIFDLLTITAGLYAKFALEISAPLFAFPLLGMEILPPIIFGLFIVGILATIMSTVDSLGFISAITFGRDIMWRIQVADAGKTPDIDRTMTPMVQKGLFVMAFLALALAVTIPSVVRLWYMTGSIIVPGLLLPFLMTFRTHHINSVNIIQLMTLPVMIAIIWFIMGNLTDGYPFGLEPFYPGLLTSLFIFSFSGLNGSRDRTKIPG